jgi:hypothetical protein
MKMKGGKCGENTVWTCCLFVSLFRHDKLEVLAKFVVQTLPHPPSGNKILDFAMHCHGVQKGAAKSL